MRCVGVGPAVGNADQVRPVVLQLEAPWVILELTAIYALGVVDSGLVDETVDYAVEVTPIQDVRWALFT